LDINEISDTVQTTVATLPEVEIFIGLLVIFYLLDQKQIQTVTKI
jgi:hypothetical protein